MTDVPESLPDGRRSLRLRSGRRQIADMPPVTNVRFYIDAESGEPHLYRHRVSVEEAEAVLSRPLEDRLGHDGARVAIGQTHAGRYLRVIYIPDPEPGSVFCITAFDLGPKALRALRRRRKRKS